MRRAGPIALAVAALVLLGRFGFTLGHRVAAAVLRALEDARALTDQPSPVGRSRGSRTT